jgi:hypothetical protein
MCEQLADHRHQVKGLPGELLAQEHPVRLVAPARLRFTLRDVQGAVTSADRLPRERPGSLRQGTRRRR